MKYFLILSLVASGTVLTSAIKRNPSRGAGNFHSYLNYNLKYLCTKVNVIKQEVNETSNAVTDLQQQANDLQECCDETRVAIEDLQQQANGTSNAVTDLQQQANDLQECCDETRVAIDDLQQQANETSNAVTDLQQQANDLQECCDETRVAIEDLQRQIDEFNEPVAFLAVLEEKRKPVAKDATIVFDTDVTNIGYGYSTSDGQFTAPKSGLYQISASIMANNNAEIWTNILHNGQIVSRVYARASDGEHDQGAHTILLKLTEGDTVSVQNIVQNNVVYGERYSMFSGALLNYMPPAEK